MTFAFVLFFGLVAGLVLVPLLPGILEWRRPTDTTPLTVVQHSDVDIRYFAHRFRTRVGEYLAEPLARCRETGAVQEGDLGGQPYRVMPARVAPALSDTEQSLHRLDRILLGCGDLELPDGLVARREIYAEGSVRGGAGGVYRAILAAGDVTLGPGSRTLRWIHADGAVRLGPDSRAHGRLSSDHVVRLAEGVEFERVRARQVEFGRIEPALHPVVHPELPTLEPGGLRRGSVIEAGADRWLVKGDCEVPPGVRLKVDLIVTGKCWIGRGTELARGVKSHEELVVGEQVRIRGAVVSERDVVIGAGCRIEGPIVGERRVRLGAGVTVGDTDRPTTVSGRDLEITGGTVVHGTLWAHRRGLVSAAPSPASAAQDVTAP